MINVLRKIYNITPPEQAGKIESFEDFFTMIQEETNFFKGKDKKPYRLFDQQINWQSLFDINIKAKQRCLLGSRSKGKSEIVTILGTAWQIYQNPKIMIGIMSLKYDNAQKFVHQILAILEVVDIKLNSRNGGYYTDQAFSATPTLMAVGLRTAVRGLHFDFVILDDPLTSVEERSKKLIEKTRTFLNEAASLSENTILIGQLLTRNDLYYDAFSDATGTRYKIESWHGDIPELDRDIETLSAEIGLKDVARNYLGYIDDKEEAIFKGIQFDNSKPTGFTYSFIDPSAKGRDYTAIAIGWINDARIVIRGYLIKSHWGECIDQLSELCKDCRITYFEDNHGTALGTFLRERGIKNVGVTTTANKIAKIYSLRGLILADRLRLSNDMDSLSVMQVKDWTETAENDDLPDAIAMLVQKIGWIRGR